MAFHIRTEQPVIFFLLVKLRGTRRNLVPHIPGGEGGARLEDQGATAGELECPPSPSVLWNG